MIPGCADGVRQIEAVKLGRIKEMSAEMNLKSRKKRAAAAAKIAGVDCLLVTHLPDVRYLVRLYGIECGAGAVAADAQCCLPTDAIRPRQRPRLWEAGW